MKNARNTTGNISLKREKKDFQAAFSIINGSLPDLLKNSSLLHPNEQAYYDTLKYDKRRLSYLLGRIAAKKAIAELVGDDGQSVFIDFGIFQFPVVKSTKNFNIQVSISHCDHIGIVLAFPEEHPLGIDIEKIQEDPVVAMKEQLTDAELDLISACQIQPAIGCTVVWTVKEAISKIFKTGLTIDFKMLEIQSLKKEGSVYLTSFKHCVQYKAVSYHSDNYICSIVLPKHTIADLEQFRDAFSNTVIEKDEG